MLKGEDIVLLLKLAAAPTTFWTVRDLEVATKIPKSTVQRALERLEEAGLMKPDQRSVRISQAEEFLIHGMRYVFPARLGSETRGIPAAWAAEPLAEHIANSGSLPPVWPHAHGQVRGLTLEPLHRYAINAAVTDPGLAQLLALADAIRAGDARIRGLAADLLSNRLDGVIP